MIGVLPAVALGLLYAGGVAAGPRAWPAARTAAAMAAVAVLAVALGPLDAGADRHLADHMVQHVLIGGLAPPLVAVSAPVRLALAAAAPGGRRALGRLLHRRAFAILLQPVVAVALAAATLLALHLPGVMELVQRHPLVHALDHAALFWTATLAWVALLGVDPVPAAPGPVGVVVAGAAWMLPMSLVGALYANADHVLVEAYASGSDALNAQRDAGTVMLLAGPAVMLPFLLGGAARGLRAEEARQRRREGAEGLR